VLKLEKRKEVKFLCTHLSLSSGVVCGWIVFAAYKATQMNKTSLQMEKEFSHRLPPPIMVPPPHSPVLS